MTTREFLQFFTALFDDINYVFTKNGYLHIVSAFIFACLIYRVLRKYVFN